MVSYEDYLELQENPSSYKFHDEKLQQCMNFCGKCNRKGKIERTLHKFNSMIAKSQKIPYTKCSLVNGCMGEPFINHMCDVIRHKFTGKENCASVYTQCGKGHGKAKFAACKRFCSDKKLCTKADYTRLERAIPHIHLIGGFGKMCKYYRAAAHGKEPTYYMDENMVSEAIGETQDMMDETLETVSENMPF